MKHLLDLRFSSDVSEVVLRDQISYGLPSFARWRSERSSKPLELELTEDDCAPIEGLRNYRLEIYSSLPVIKAEELARRLESELKFGYGLMYSRLSRTAKPPALKPAPATY